MEYEVQLQGARGGHTAYRVINWLRSRWVTAQGTPGQPATALTITPGSPTREYGGTDDLSYTVSGLADGDAAEDVVTGALARASGNDAGTYAINMGTLAIASAYAGKYTLPSSPSVATYTIRPRAITAIGGVTVNERAGRRNDDGDLRHLGGDGNGRAGGGAFGLPGRRAASQRVLPGGHAGDTRPERNLLVAG